MLLAVQAQRASAVALLVAPLVAWSLWRAMTRQGSRGRQVLRARIAAHRARTQAQVEEAANASMQGALARGDRLVAELDGASFVLVQRKLQSGEVSAQEALAALRRLAARASQRLNCVTGFILGADQEAETLDGVQREGIAAEGDSRARPLGILHGVPISVKESINVAGHASTAGLSKRIGTLAPSDAPMIAALRKAGAVPFCQTNLPQTNLSYGCSNPLFGATLSPLDAARTPGGSSGGEAALIAAGGSVLGIGADIGGSVRVPAAFCGICGFKPGSLRSSFRGSYSSTAGQSGVAAAAGPMCRSVAGLEAVMRVVTGPTMHALDASVPPLPWDDAEFASRTPLRIGFYIADGFIPATPACARAVREACGLLSIRGHEIIPFTPPRAPHGVRLFFKLLTSDGGEAVMEALDGEEIDDSLGAFVAGVTATGSRASKRLEASLREKGLTRGPDLMNAVGRTSVREYWRTQAEKNALRAEWEEAWKTAGLDCVITPAHVMPPPPPHVVAASGATLCYTQLFNLLDFPAGTLPVSSVTEEDEAGMAAWPASIIQEQFGAETDALISSGDIYGPQGDALEEIVRTSCVGSTGLPVSVQVVALPWHEERCLRVMAEIEEAREAERVLQILHHSPLSDHK